MADIGQQLTVGIGYSYDSSGIKKAQQDIQNFASSASTNLSKSNEQLAFLSGLMSSLGDTSKYGQSFTITSKKIENATSKLQNKFTSATAALEKLQAAEEYKSGLKTQLTPRAYNMKVVSGQQSKIPGVADSLSSAQTNIKKLSGIFANVNKFKGTNDAIQKSLGSTRNNLEEVNKAQTKYNQLLVKYSELNKNVVSTNNKLNKSLTNISNVIGSEDSLKGKRDSKLERDFYGAKTTQERIDIAKQLKKSGKYKGNAQSISYFDDYIKYANQYEKTLRQQQSTEQQLSSSQTTLIQKTNAFRNSIISLLGEHEKLVKSEENKATNADKAVSDANIAVDNSIKTLISDMCELIKLYNEEGLAKEQSAKLEVEKAAKKEAQERAKAEREAAKEAREATKEQEKAAKIAQLQANRLMPTISKIQSQLKSFRITSLLSYYYVIKRLTSALTNLIDKSSSWIENLNLLEVVFKETNEQAKEFIYMASDTFGLDVNELAKYVATFKQMANAMGQANDVGTAMAETLSLIALDVGSLRNIDTETVVSDFTSALAGQVKPVRKYGFDITQYSMDELTQELGYGSISNSMSQQEKQLTRAILLIRQAKDSYGDLGRTINTFANQQRIVNSQLDILQRLLGNILLGTFNATDSFEDAWKTAGIGQKAIWTLNGALLALNELLNELVPSQSDFSLGTIATESEDATDALEELEDATNGTLADFDKFNTLGESSNGIGISETLESLLEQVSSEYLTQWTEMTKSIDMYATTIKDKFISAFKSIGIFGGDANETLDKLRNSLKGIIMLLVGLKSPVMALMTSSFIDIGGTTDDIDKIAKAFANFIDLFSKLGEAVYNFLSSNGVQAFVKEIITIVTNVLNWSSSLTNLETILWTVITAMIAFKAISFAVELTKIIKATKTLISSIGSTKLSIIAMIAVIAVLIITIIDLVKHWKEMTDGQKAFKIILVTLLSLVLLFIFNCKVLIPFVNTLRAISNCLGGNLAMINTHLGQTILLVGSIIALVGGIVLFAESFENLGNVAKWLIPILSILAGVITAIVAAKSFAEGNWVKALSVGVLVTGIGLMVGTTLSAQAHADGGFQTGGLFYAGESGAEWVGSQGNTSTILNDRQMSDIMMEAVAKGVVIGNNGQQTRHSNNGAVIVNLDGKQLFQVVEENGKRYGKVFARSK